MMKTGKGGGIARTVLLPDEGESIYHMQLLQYVINITPYTLGHYCIQHNIAI